MASLHWLPTRAFSMEKAFRLPGSTTAELVLFLNA
jgi:hypothetical protein